MKAKNINGRLAQFLAMLMAMILITGCMAVPVALGESTTNIKYSVAIDGTDYQTGKALRKEMQANYPNIINEVLLYISPDDFSNPISDENQYVVVCLNQDTEYAAPDSAFYELTLPNIFFGIDIGRVSVMGRNDPEYASFYWTNAIVHVLTQGTELHLYCTAEGNAAADLTRSIFSNLIENGVTIVSGGVETFYTFEEVADGVYTIKDFDGCGTIQLINAEDPIIGEDGTETPLWQCVYNDMLVRIGAIEPE